MKSENALLSALPFNFIAFAGLIVDERRSKVKYM